MTELFPAHSAERDVPHLLIAVTGGIAAYKTAQLVRLCRQAGYEVRVIMTSGAQAFVTPLTFQALSGHPVHTSLLDPAAEAGMGHIELARWADLLLIAPASANTLGRLAAGLADDLLATVVLATRAPVWLAPAMNQQMWQSTAVQRNLQQLRALGYHLIDPAVGEQACGDVGPGRMPEPDDLFGLMRQQLRVRHTPQRLAGKRVVITAGPTREALDPVRYVSNHSSGKMGFALAEACRDAGADVTLLAGPVHLPTPVGVQRVNIESAEDLLAASQHQVDLGCDVFVATAAVADYRSAQTADHKIKKSGETFSFDMVRNPDIVASIAARPDKPFVVGFAAETRDVEQYAQGKLRDKNLDMIACNDVSRQDIGFGSDDNAMVLFFAEHCQLPPRHLDKASKTVIATQLVQSLAQALQRCPARGTLQDTGA